jgi:hypothetical protein
MKSKIQEYLNKINTTMGKTKILKLLFLLMIVSASVSAQKAITSERFGNTLNLGIGLGYYGYVGHSMPVLHANYEIDVVNNFTLAPFITYYSYQKKQKWGNRDYFYRVSVIPIGVKGSYYFDQLLHANSRWDFYLAGSLGFAIRQTSWENGYFGETSVNNGSSGLYLDAHIGSEYHINNNVGLFLDLSTGISTFGLAVHL